MKHEDPFDEERRGGWQWTMWPPLTQRMKPPLNQRMGDQQKPPLSPRVAAVEEPPLMVAREKWWRLRGVERMKPPLIQREDQKKVHPDQGR